MVRGAVRLGTVDALRVGLAEGYYAAARDRPGIVRAHAALRSVRDGHAFAFVSVWSSPDDVLAAFGRGVERVGLIPNVTEHLDVGAVEHYEVDEALFDRSPSAPSVLRIAAGSVELGSDAEIQQELRRRLPELGPDVVEAEVGRRIHGPMVEVAFVTLWSARPQDQVLEEPLWPDVADLYRSYWIETYDELDPGKT